MKKHNPNIHKKISSLSTDQLMELQSAMFDASIAGEMNGNWREVFRLKRHKYKVGSLRKIYDYLYTMPDYSIDALSRSISNCIS